ncbi:two-component sensor histidine kinase [Mesorhizobium sp. L-8-10]|uniref:sensor histidine kinase n=1 Tax=unclassified Mesorhizobium TaxID=325217 RepID=UPI001926337E|nr:MULTISPECIES: HAMP domain-containing sensor histidine kinase [unclassified Mesorhizobium]BCH27435.1 two-component sensor histidine kinase [Mesorhizobium sp. L-8-3]BCH35393.1 two-component sensor histidine kinase [Mesorhizobium sp. L-8-10]
MNFRRLLRRPRSLKWRLVWRMVLLQVVLLTLLVALILGAFLVTGWIPQNYEGRALDVLTKQVRRDADGELVLKDGSDLAELREEVPDLWFIIRDEEGHRLSEGTVPPQFTRMAAALDHIDSAKLVWKLGTTLPAAVVQWFDTKAGRVQIFTGAQGRFRITALLAVTPELFVQVILPIGGIMALASLVTIPLVVRGILTGLRRAAARAEHIDIEKRGVRLPTAGIPTEIEPLVKAVNGALDRLDAGYERHRRFLTDAAHELRTPVAILNTRIASLPPTSERSRLQQDAARLSTLTDQLLDIQRLDRRSEPFQPVDLVAAAHGVVADLAPMAFGAGYDMSFDAAPGRIVTTGDRMSIERAVTNLVQNAIEHGGNGGKITISVAAPAVIAVSDEGEGVPQAEREKIFQPFYRLRQRDQGAGLGLNLVAEIMQMHGGRVELNDVQPKGACFRMIFRPERTA